MTIDVSKLTEKDIGRQVVYTTPEGYREYGHLSSFRNGSIWVRFRGPTGEMCPPDRCFFAFPERGSHEQ